MERPNQTSEDGTYDGNEHDMTVRTPPACNMRARTHQDMSGKVDLGAVRRRGVCAPRH